MTLRLATAATAIAIAMTLPATTAEARRYHKHHVAKVHHIQHVVRKARSSAHVAVAFAASNFQDRNDAGNGAYSGGPRAMPTRGVFGTHIARAHAVPRSRVASAVKPKAQATSRTAVARNIVPPKPETPVAAIARRTGSGYRGMLWAKVQELILACGSKVVSGYRAGSMIGGRLSNHGRVDAEGHALAYDMHGNPGCMYGLLKGWPGGATSDYATAPYVQHIHLSLNPGGYEMGWKGAHHHVSGDTAYLYGGGATRVASRYSKRNRYAVRRVYRQHVRYAHAGW